MDPASVEREPEDTGVLNLLTHTAVIAAVAVVWRLKTCICGPVCMNVCEYAYGSQMSTSGVFLSLFPPYFLRQSPSSEQ